MYFLKYRTLKDRLRNRSVTVRDSLPYLLAMIIITELFPSSPYSRGSIPFWDTASDILSVAIFIGGILYVYYKNGGSEGKDFFVKFILIGWVASVRAFFVFIPYVIICAYIGRLTGLMLEEFGAYDTFCICLFEIIIFQRIGKHISDTEKEQMLTT